MFLAFVSASPVPLRFLPAVRRPRPRRLRLPRPPTVAARGAACRARLRPRDRRSLPSSGPRWRPSASRRTRITATCCSSSASRPCGPGRAAARTRPMHANYDEAKANPFPDWPDVLTLKNGQRVTTASDWWHAAAPGDRRGLRARGARARAAAACRRSRGRSPRRVEAVVGTRAGRRPQARRSRRQLDGAVDRGRASTSILVTPAAGQGPGARDDHVPARDAAAGARRTAAAAGLLEPAAAAWRRSAGLRAADRGGVGLRVPEPRERAGRQRRRADEGHHRPRQRGQRRKPEDWGSLRAWAWGASRALDYLETDPAVDAKRVGIDGVSRYGKAALVTMAFDQRFAVVLVGSSGEGGAKPHRRNFGEAVENLTGAGEYHWMAGNFLKYGDVGLELRQPERERHPGGRAPADRAVRAARHVHQLRHSREGRREVARSAGQLHGHRRGRRRCSGCWGSRRCRRRRTTAPPGCRPTTRRCSTAGSPGGSTTAGTPTGRTGATSSRGPTSSWGRRGPRRARTSGSGPGSAIAIDVGGTCEGAVDVMVGRWERGIGDGARSDPSWRTRRGGATAAGGRRRAAPVGAGHGRRRTRRRPRQQRRRGAAGAVRLRRTPWTEFRRAVALVGRVHARARQSRHRPLLPAACTRRRSARPSAVLARLPDSPQANYLLGLIARAANQPDVAAACFAKRAVDGPRRRGREDRPGAGAAAAAAVRRGGCAVRRRGEGRALQPDRRLQPTASAHTRAGRAGEDGRTRWPASRRCARAATGSTSRATTSSRAATPRPSRPPASSRGSCRGRRQRCASCQHRLDTGAPATAEERGAAAGQPDAGGPRSRRRPRPRRHRRTRARC